MSKSAVPLRVWVVDPISYSGMAYYDASLVRALRARGVDAELIGSDSWMLGPDPDVPRVPLFQGTHGSGPRISKGLAYLRSLLRLMVATARHRPDIIHWVYLEVPSADLLAMLSIRLSGVPVLLTAHEPGSWTPGWHHRALYRLLYATANRIIVHNDTTRAELLRRFGVPARKVSMIEHGDYQMYAEPDIPQPDARDRLSLPSDVPIALFFGSLRPSKGLDVLLEAWPAVLRQIPEALLVVAGEPPRGLGAESLTSLVVSLGTSSGVRAELRQIDPAEANAFYRASDVVVLPYLAIGTSGVLRYAYSSARPVIASAVGEHNIWVIPGDTGCLVPPGVPGALASALVKVLGDRPGAAAMGERALELSNNQFAWSDISLATIRLYEQILHERPFVGGA